MQVINLLFGIPLGYLMFACFALLGNYGAAIILFTLLTKVIMLPLSLIAQKNSIVMVKLRPYLDDIKQRNFGNSALIVEEQKALYKKEGYSSLKSMLPLLIQVPIILGLIDVIYHPLQHLLHLDTTTINSYLQLTAQHLGVTLESMGSGAQLKVLEIAQANPALYSGLQGLADILKMNLRFLGTNLAQVPTLASLSILYPILSGLSALALSIYQNKRNILQQVQGPVGKWGMTIFLVAFATLFAYFLPSGIGLYWIVGNLLSIPVLTICNKVYDPSGYAESIATPKKPKLTPEERRAESALKRKKKLRQKVDKKRFLSEKDKQLVFYSEASGFYKYFEGFIQYVLDHSEITIHYVTNDIDDQIFSHQNPRLKAYYIGPVALIQFMMLMDADMVVMTTPDLEKYHLKRSLVRKDIEYVYLDHGMTSFHLMLKQGALDAFDTIFCYGPNHIAEVRETEKVYQLPAKRLVKTGFPLLDRMLHSVQNMPPQQNDPKVILIAPSWQKDNLLEYCLQETVRPLLGLGYRIIIRPHPEFIKRFPAKMQKVFNDFQTDIGDNLHIQTDFSSSETVYTADLVITDWSSIAHEFSYATKKPSLFINTPMKIMNPEYTRIPSIPLDISLREEIGVSVDVEDLSTLPTIVEQLFSKREWYRHHIEEVVKANIFDVGDGARGGGDYIIRTLQAKAQARGAISLHATQAGDTGTPSPEAFMLDELEQRVAVLGRARMDNPQHLSDILNQPLPASLDSSMTRGQLLFTILQDVENVAQEGGRDQ